MSSRSFRPHGRKLGVAALAASLGLAGLGLAGAAPASAAEVSTVTDDCGRLAGQTRFGTAGAIADAYEASSDTDTAIVANGFNFPDALAASGLARELDAPVLLVNQDSVPLETASALQDLDIVNVVIVGGTAAVSADVAAELDEDYTVTREAGNDRYETAEEIAAAVGTPGELNGLTTALIATGNNYPDALAGGPVAYAGDGTNPFPILLTNGSTVPEATERALDELGVEQVIILGGTDAVPAAAETALETQTGNAAIRLAGTTREGTAQAVADFAVAELDFNPDAVLLADGRLRFPSPDALTGGPLGGLLEAPILLVNPGMPAQTEEFITDNAAAITQVVALGGTAAISEDILEAGCEAAGVAVPGEDNQTFAVAGPTETRTAGGAPSAANTRTCTVTGIPAGSVVDAVLLPSEDITTDSSGNVLFQDANSNNVADEDAVGAVIVNVNGTNTAGTQRVNDINAAIGAISVTIYGAASDDVTLVVHGDQAGLNANALDLAVPASANANAKAPREVFGVGCRTIFANEAANGAINTTVASTAKDQDLFTGTPGDLTYFYDANDVFQIGGVQVSMAAFEAALSPSDTVTGTYAADPQFPSTFNLTDAAPVAPASVTPTVTGTTVTLTFPESTTPTTDSYNVYRVVRPSSGTCPDFNTTAGRTAFGAPVGAVTDPTPGTVGGTNLTHTSSGLDQSTFYCFAVSAVDEGDESNTGATANNVQTTTPADTGAPTIADVRAADAGTIGLIDTGDVHQFIFSEAMAQTVDDPGQLYRVQDGDGSVGEIVCGTNATCVLQGAGTFNGTAYTANRVLRVTITGPVPALTGFLGTVPGVSYPATITNVSAGWDDTTGNQLNLAGSADRVVNVDTITPTPAAETVAPNVASSVADESANTVTLTYNEAVVCDNSAAAAAAFGYTDVDNTDTAPTAITCNGTTTVVLTFAAGVIQVADGAANINYTDEAGAVDTNDVRDLNGNQALSPDNNVPTVQA